MRIEGETRSDFKCLKSDPTAEALCLHRAIFAIPEQGINFAGREIIPLSSSSSSMDNIFSKLGRREPDARVQVEANISWGGEGGVKSDVSVTGSVRDKEKEVNITYSHNSEGENRVQVSGSAGSERETSERSETDYR